MTRGALLLTILLVAAPAAAQDVERARTTLNNPTVFGTIWFGPARAKVSSGADGTVVITNSAATLGVTFKVDALATATFGAGTGLVVAGSTATVGAAVITNTTGSVSVQFNGAAFNGSIVGCSFQHYGANHMTFRISAISATGVSVATSPSLVANDVFYWQCLGSKQ